MKRFYFFILLFCLNFFVVNSVLSSSKSQSSEDSFNKIQKIVNAFVKAGEDLSNPKVKKSVLQEVSQFFPLVPAKKADTRSASELREEARSIISKKFPGSVLELREKAKEEAEKKFKPAKTLERVTVRYERGSKTYTVKGIFYGYGGNSVRIGDKIVAIYDLSPESRYKFDKEFCAKKKKEYVEKKVSSYQFDKIRYSTDLNKKLKENQIYYNEKEGYIYYRGNWITPMEATEVCINAVAPKIEKKIAKAAETGPEEKETQQPEGGEEKLSPEEKKQQFEKEYYENLKKTIEKKRMEIANSYAGIDADQGYNNNMLIWGMTKDDVIMVLNESKENIKSGGEKSDGTLPKENDSMEIIPKNGPIEKVTLLFLHGIFYKVEVDFKIVSNATMARLASILNERYGLTDEQKELKKKMEENGQEFDEAEKIAEDKRKETKDLASIPREERYHWTGNITYGTAYVKLNSDKSGYEEFKFIKENPKVKQEAHALMKKEQQHKAEEKRRKELESYMKKKITF